MSLNGFLNSKILSRSAIDEIKTEFALGRPFPYAVIDDFFELETFKKINRAMEDVYANRGLTGVSYETSVENGKWGSTKRVLPQELTEVKDVFSSSHFLRFIEEVTGFKKLSVTQDINGGGFSFFHAMAAGGYLGPHTDHTRDRTPEWGNMYNNGAYHVANIIVYMSKMWSEEFGGGTQLYSDPVTVAATIPYKPNRALIFMHSTDSIHGTQRTALTAPPRYSLYYDFYTREVTPFRHLGLEGLSLHGSPHLFYLPSRREYFKLKNLKYTVQHLRGLLGKIHYNVFGD
ncbi:MAG: 2OG-Fe(II) oxygenase [Gammaproteobacteria bacterium]|nr:2OG-Fe(II) oxygenase [Gammaproteobacteria bacterium]